MPIVRIDSYFSLPTDLAGMARSWPEFVSGQEYSVEFAHADGPITVQLVLGTGDDCKHVVVQSEQESRLFYSVLGFVSFALAAHSDNLQVMRWGPVQ
jgi:hypothetical protein